jgi:hypothetical protein
MTNKQTDKISPYDDISMTGVGILTASSKVVHY